MATINLRRTAAACSSALIGLCLWSSPALAGEPPPAAPATKSDPAAATKSETAPPSKKEPAPGSEAAPTTKSEPAPPPVKPADSGKEETPAWETVAAERRAGFTVGVLLGAATGVIGGYPNDINKVGRADFYADTGASIGANATLFLGGALTDWLVFGAGLSGGRSQGNGIIVQGLTFVLHTELFPLFWRGGLWRDMGIAVDTGAGNFVGELENKPAGDAGKLVPAVMDSGAVSRLTVSLFYDGFRVSKLSGGPFVAFDYAWSATMQRPLAVVGFRGALYVKAPKKK